MTYHGVSHICDGVGDYLRHSLTLTTVNTHTSPPNISLQRLPKTPLYKPYNFFNINNLPSGLWPVADRGPWLVAHSHLLPFLPALFSTPHLTNHFINRILPHDHKTGTDSMTTIHKDFSFVYGHRLWNQQVPPYPCRHLHGHSGKLRFTLEASRWENGMIFDFTALKPFKKILDDSFDHRFFMDIDDPLLLDWFQHYGLGLDDLHDWNGFYTVKSELEFFNSLVIVPFVPTSEELSKFFFCKINQWLSGITDRVTCCSCTLLETESSGATYEPTKA